MSKKSLGRLFAGKMSPWGRISTGKYSPGGLLGSYNSTLTLAFRGLFTAA